MLGLYSGIGLLVSYRSGSCKRDVCESTPECFHRKFVQFSPLPQLVLFAPGFYSNELCWFPFAKYKPQWPWPGLNSYPRETNKHIKAVQHTPIARWPLSHKLPLWPSAPICMRVTTAHFCNLFIGYQSGFLVFQFLQFSVPVTWMHCTA